jgi:hypothetical protein
MEIILMGVLEDRVPFGKEQVVAVEGSLVAAVVQAVVALMAAAVADLRKQPLYGTLFEMVQLWLTDEMIRTTIYV